MASYVNVVDKPLSKANPLHTIDLLPTINTPESDTVPGTKSNPEGNRSSIAIPVASPVPKFSNSILNVTLSPTAPEAGSTVFVI